MQDVPETRPQTKPGNLPSSVNFMTIDFEEIYHAEVFRRSQSLSQPITSGRYLDANAQAILEILERNKIKATFFVLGEIADKYRDILQTIVSQGHDVGSHGLTHTLLTKLSPTQARYEIEKSKAIIEDATGRRVISFRAPTFSLGLENEYLFETLMDAGYEIDSSVNNFRGNPMYATSRYPDGPFVFKKGGRSLIEVPVCPARLGSKQIAFSGGGYFRLLPFWAFKILGGRTETSGPGGFNFYAHPWEFGIDAYEKVIDFSKMDAKSRFRLLVNIKKMPEKFSTLCSSYRFGLVSEIAALKATLPVVELQGSPDMIGTPVDAHAS